MSSLGFWKPASSSAAAASGGYLRDDDGRGGESSSILVPPPPQQRGANTSTSTLLQQQRRLLPIFKHQRQILYAVEHYSVVVIVGETGSGKSTQIPQYLVQAGGWAAHDFQVVVTQPRRMAAITLAQRVAQEVGDVISDSENISNLASNSTVGYTVRFDDQTGPRTQIKYVTDGVLLQEATKHDPLLSHYSVVMVDEAHERTLNSDAVLGLLRKIQVQRRSNNLRLIVCSATINAMQFLEFFTGGKNKNEGSTTGTIISVDGRQYPVDVFYLQQPAPDYLTAAVETVWKIVLHQQQHGDGDILCFLPTSEDIDRAIRLSEDYFDQQNERQPQKKKQQHQVDFLPLYGTLPYHMQVRIFQQQDNKQQQRRRRRRRVIYATNIAETSVTVPGIRYVIDSGLVKLPYFDPTTSLERLLVGPVSQASAQQRCGRAGRIHAGQCYRLYTEKYLMEHMQPHTPPEILRTNLTSFILTLKALGVDNILAFDLMDIPNVEALQHGLESLYALGAIDDRTRLTQAGLDMATFPVEPRVARMLLESLSEGCSWEVLAVASALQVRELFLRPPRRQQQQQQQMIEYEAAMSEIADESGDLVTYANVFALMDDLGLDENDCKERFINYLALRRGIEVRNQLARFLRKFGRVQAVGVTGGGGDAQQTRSKAIRRCFTAGFFFNVAKLGNDGQYYTLRKHILVKPNANSILASKFSQISSEYIVYGETFDGARGGIELRSVSAIEAKWLRELAPHYWE